MSVRPYHHGDLRTALLASAERTLLEKGVAALSLRELARDIGVSHAAPGRHFKDKQALVDALALTGFERMTKELTAADHPDLPLQARLTELATTYVRFAVTNAELLEVMYSRKHDADISEQLRAAVDGTTTQFVQIVIDAQERGEMIPGPLDLRPRHRRRPPRHSLLRSPGHPHPRSSGLRSPHPDPPLADGPDTPRELAGPRTSSPREP